MMRAVHLLKLSLCAALLAVMAGAAAAAMTAEEFDAYTEGRTLYYAQDGRDYGVEQYLPGRRVRWSFLDGKCKTGRWYAEAERICFVYDDNPAPQCWTFERSGGGLRALFEDAPGQIELYEARASEEPMLCLGPEVGV